MPKKIVQITPGTYNGLPTVFALTEDGAVYVLSYGAWLRVPDIY